MVFVVSRSQLAPVLEDGEDSGESCCQVVSYGPGKQVRTQRAGKAFSQCRAARNRKGSFLPAPPLWLAALTSDLVLGWELHVYDISASSFFACRIPETGECPVPTQRHPVI